MLIMLNISGKNKVIKCRCWMNNNRKTESTGNRYLIKIQGYKYFK